jgi:hypothetical protein
MDAPLFIYSRPVVKSLPRLGDGLQNSSLQPYRRIYDGLLKLIRTHVASPYRHLIPYTQCLFSHEVIQQPRGIPEFGQSKALSLAPDTVISYQGIMYLPTAWTLREKRMVPYEFINSRKVPTYKEINFDSYRHLWKIIEEQHDELLGHVTLRQLEAAWCGAKYGEGAFRVFDAPIMRNWMEMGRKSLSSHNEEEEPDMIEFRSAYLQGDLEDYMLEYYVDSFEE